VGNFLSSLGHFSFSTCHNRKAAFDSAHIDDGDDDDDDDNGGGGGGCGCGGGNDYNDDNSDVTEDGVFREENRGFEMFTLQV
jgi:hypothetical protein